MSSNGDYKRKCLMDQVEKGKYPANEAARNAINYFYNRKPYQYTQVEPKNRTNSTPYIEGETNNDSS